LNVKDLTVHLIDVGPGLAAFIQAPIDGYKIFIDGGEWGTDDMMDYMAEFILDDDEIDLLIVTHPDKDHYFGAKKIIDKYQVNEFWYTGYTCEALEEYDKWTDFLEAVENGGNCTSRNPIGECRQVGDIITLDNQGTTTTEDDLMAVLLNVDADPPEKDPVFGREFVESERRNNASLVFKLIYGDNSFLFTGDINGRDKDSDDPDLIDSEELELWTRHTLQPEKFDLTAEVLQVPHHGSNGASSTKFLEAVNPTWAVIAAGHRNDHPREETLERLQAVGANILRTDEGDSTPESASNHRDPRGDDCFIFQVNGENITNLLRVEID